MGLHEVKKVLHNKGNGHYIAEAVYRMGEKSLLVISEKGLITRIHREQKKNNS
jgi:hypothetical protein